MESLHVPGFFGRKMKVYLYANLNIYAVPGAIRHFANIICLSPHDNLGNLGGIQTAEEYWFLKQRLSQNSQSLWQRCLLDPHCQTQHLTTSIFELCTCALLHFKENLSFCFTVVLGSDPGGSSVVSVLISLISDTSSIRGQYIKWIFGTRSWNRSLLRPLHASQKKSLGRKC